jgi:hypothetical protein
LFNGLPCDFKARLILICGPIEANRVQVRLVTLRAQGLRMMSASAWGSGAIAFKIEQQHAAVRRQSVKATAAVRQVGESPAQPWMYYHVVHR